ncbi:MAG: mannonate dehydratase [Anaerolineae bacterium]|nr:mannonate dehydratase [Anaerolineae bacterium]
MIKLGFRSGGRLDAEMLAFARQFGADAILAEGSDLPTDRVWSYEDLREVRRRVERAGLELGAIQGMPERFYDRIRLGLPGRDEQIENVRRIVRHMGQAGIPILGYHFNQTGTAWRTGYLPVTRGGAWVTVYRHADVARAPKLYAGPEEEEVVWANLKYFLDAVMPAAEEAGVRLALHPDDPPVPRIGGAPLILRSVAAYKRASELVDSPSHAVKFCQGTVAEMCATAEEVYDAIRYFASRGKIAYVHFRNVRGRAEEFEETFIDDGKVDMLEAMRAYHESGFDGILIPDHVPGMVGDSRWGHRSRAYAFGYMKGLLRCVE